MRVMLLRRSARGGLAALTDDLAAWLPQLGFSVIVEDATWIPRETGRAVDRDVSRRLRDMGDAFDLLHAFGYRAAWACAEAFADEFFWLYSAYEAAPQSKLLIDRLNLAGLGICASNYTRNGLSGQGVQSLDQVYPGVGAGAGARLGREETRRLLGIPEDVFLVGSFRDDGLVAMFAEMPDCWFVLGERDSPRWHATNEEEAGDPANVKRVGWFPRPRDLMEACDLWVAPDRDRGFVRNVAEAMFEGTPVLVRDCAREMIEEDVSGFVYSSDEALPGRILEIRELDLTRQTIGSAGRIRARELFDMELRVADVAQRYRDLVNEAL